MFRNKAILLLLWWACAHAQYPLPPDDDRVRLAEAFALADSVQEAVWPGWSCVPFVVLLVTPDTEFLFRHPAPPDEFTSLGPDAVSGEEVFARRNTGNYPPGILATFPAVGGVSTIVIGQASNTGKSSSEWVLTALHEHFHQLQFTRPWYHEKVSALDLSNGDETGMWQLNFPYPYAEPEVAARERAWAAALQAALAEPGREAPPAASATRRKADLHAALDPRSSRYLAFQLWQEGVARYTEYEVARVAAQAHQPLAAFTRLADYMPYSQLYRHRLKQLERELSEIDPAGWGRVAFYALGAAEALLWDQAGADWKTRYWEEPFGAVE